MNPSPSPGVIYSYDGNLPPEAQDVGHDGTCAVGAELTGSYTYSDPENDAEGSSTFQWYRSPDVSGSTSVAISGATDTVYAVQPGDAGSYIGFGVTPYAVTGFPKGAEVRAVVFAGPVPGGGFFCGGPLTDSRDGQVYSTVLIGSQCWMRENLNYGVRIDAPIDQSDNGTVEKYCYDNLGANCDVYGGLYQWDEMMQYDSTPGIQGICMDGWHVPTYEEWEILYTNAGGFWIGGGKMKETGYIHWNEPNTGATNALRFTALGNGQCNGIEKNYILLKQEAYLWASTDFIANKFHAYSAVFQSINPKFYLVTPSKPTASAVRCIKNELGMNAPPSATNVGQMGESVVGETLTGIYTYQDAENDPEGTTIFKWYRAEAPQGIEATVIVRATEKTYVITDADIGKCIGFSVIPKALSGTATGIETITSYMTSQVIASSSFICGDLLLDNRDGESYATVQIGSQCWMAENLNAGGQLDSPGEHRNDGWISKFCYNNQSSGCETYGGLYLWDEMMNYMTIEGVYGICPDGWHIPTNAEWSTLADFLGGAGVAGGLLKESGLAHWADPNTGATNVSGFTALPGGNRTAANAFEGLSTTGYFWSSTSYDGAQKYAWYLFNNQLSFDHFPFSKAHAFSVRCIKN